jgi:hypothetical protein
MHALSFVYLHVQIALALSPFHLDLFSVSSYSFIVSSSNFLRAAKVTIQVWFFCVYLQLLFHVRHQYFCTSFLPSDPVLFFRQNFSKTSNHLPPLAFDVSYHRRYLSYRPFPLLMGCPDFNVVAELQTNLNHLPVTSHLISSN